ncbi:MAG: hypothetical protein IK099_00060 [Clostridia bacterium]|nr:hypothetical protein [Clostridia bacterium]
MMKMDVWGQGALFAFSGLEGKTSYDTQLVGVLLGDHPGVRFLSSNPFALYMDTTGVSDLVWDTVASDIVLGKVLLQNEWKRFCIAFQSNATVVGIVPRGRLRLVFDSRKADQSVSLKTDETEDACRFCLSLEGNADCGAQMIEEIIERRIGFFDRFQPENMKEDVGKAYLHAVSVMKTQVYSPEGIFRHPWTTPDRYPHRKLWLWDSCFHSLGNHVISERLAMDTILSLLDTQQPDGMIPHAASPDQHTGITQPPLIAWSVEKIVRRTGNTGFAAQCYGALTSYLKWDMEHRRTESGLFYWHINRDQAHNRCDESGMDNCSRFDDVEEMECIDFSCFMKREAEAMRYLAGVLKKDADAEKWAAYADTLARLINERLWDAEEGMYFDFELKTHKLHKFPSVCSFLPLFAGICSEKQKDALVASLKDANAFHTPFPIPSIPVSAPTFGTDMWCGPVWINYVYLVAEGLYRCGENSLADEIVRNTVEGIARAYTNDGVFYEYYDSLGAVSSPRLARKGTPVSPYICTKRITQTIRDYGWTATLYAALVHEHPDLFLPGGDDPYRYR